MSTIEEIAEISGAKLAAKMPDSELVSFRMLQSGDVAIELADGTKLTVASRRHLDGETAPPGALTAEDFVSLMSLFTTLPIGARPEGRRFIRRTAISFDGKPCMRFSEAGRDV